MAERETQLEHQIAHIDRALEKSQHIVANGAVNMFPPEHHPEGTPSVDIITNTLKLRARRASFVEETINSVQPHLTLLREDVEFMLHTSKIENELADDKYITPEENNQLISNIKLLELSIKPDEEAPLFGQAEEQKEDTSEIEATPPTLQLPRVYRKNEYQYLAELLVKFTTSKNVMSPYDIAELYLAEEINTGALSFEEALLETRAALRYLSAHESKGFKAINKGTKRNPFWYGSYTEEAPVEQPEQETQKEASLIQEPVAQQSEIPPGIPQITSYPEVAAIANEGTRNWKFYSLFLEAYAADMRLDMNDLTHEIFKEELASGTIDFKEAKKKTHSSFSAFRDQYREKGIIITTSGEWGNSDYGLLSLGNDPITDEPIEESDSDSEPSEAILDENISQVMHEAPQAPEVKQNSNIVVYPYRRRFMIDGHPIDIERGKEGSRTLRILRALMDNPDEELTASQLGGGTSDRNELRYIIQAFDTLVAAIKKVDRKNDTFQKTGANDTLRFSFRGKVRFDENRK